VNEETTPKGITWKRHRAGAIAGAALAALTMIGVASSGSAHGDHEGADDNPNAVRAKWLGRLNSLGTTCLLRSELATFANKGPHRVRPFSRSRA
jgi:thiamine monophosphate synthase